MPRDPFVELEGARANVLMEAERFVRELERVLGPSLHARFERLRLAQAGHVARLDDMTNRVWVAISAAARPLDPVLEEFGFRPERRRLGGGSFGVSARTLPQLDPSGAIGQRWKRYRAAYERLTVLAAFEP
jgi:hypothetical protein